MQIACEQCGKEKNVYSSCIKRGGGKFCSNKCRGIHHGNITRGVINPNEIKEDGNGHIRIRLSENEWTIIDSCDYKKVKIYRWFLLKHPTNNYAVANPPKHNNIKGNSVRIHKLICVCDKGYEVGHINGNGLDNRRSNLKPITHQQNSFSHRINTNNTSGNLGVSWSKKENKWISMIGINGITKRLGCFVCLSKAIQCRKSAEETLFGDYKKGNNYGKVFFNNPT